MQLYKLVVLGGGQGGGGVQFWKVFKRKFEGLLFRSEILPKQT